MPYIFEGIEVLSLKSGIKISAYFVFIYRKKLTWTNVTFKSKVKTYN